jgi:hypothetical protein
MNTTLHVATGVHPDDHEVVLDQISGELKHAKQELQDSS